MGNPLFNLLSGFMNFPAVDNNFISQFQNFMQQMRGKNPQQILNQVIKENGITEQQFEQIKEQALKIAPQLENLKNMFGF